MNFKIYLQSSSKAMVDREKRGKDINTKNLMKLEPQQSLLIAIFYSTKDVLSNFNRYPNIDKYL